VPARPMDDATLNPQSDARQGLRDDLGPIVKLLEPTLGPLDGAPQPLSGGITNRNYRAAFAGRGCVIRVPGKDTSLLGIDRAGERLANELAASIGVAPEVLASLEEPACIVTAFVEGRGIEPKELRGSAQLAKVAAALRAVHDLQTPLTTTFSAYAVIDSYAAIALERGGALPEAFASSRGCAAEIEAALDAPEHAPVPCHNDLLAGNFIAAGERLWIVDWEYAGMGDRYFDLANFSVNNELGEGAEEELLNDYFGEPPNPRRLASLRLMRFMSDFREAMWGVVQGTISELEFDFAEYADKHFDRLLETASDRRFGSWLQEAHDSAR
jgi:thiamine kinase-like enzyme